VTDGPDNTREPAVVLTAPRDGTPEPVVTPAGLTRAAELLAAGTGPVAVDAERASGYRYTHRAYLVQLRREGAGTILIDPLPFSHLREIAEAIVDEEWVLHAASQDLPCLVELGLRPTRLFDTELAGRLANFERVGLAALTEQLLGFGLEKHHSAADWSTRPLPDSWISYAALDVELLVGLRDALEAELTEQGKIGWAHEEFEALVASAGRTPAPRPDPWRRTSGIHKIRGIHSLARVRALWYARDRMAARRDAAPGRILSDAAIVAAATADPKDERELLALPGFGGRSVRRHASVWLEALAEARALSDGQLPVPPLVEGPPPPHRWAERDPVAAARLVRCRAVVTRLAAEHNLPPENLVAPDSIRRLAWSPPDPATLDAVVAALAATGVRGWQSGLIADDLAQALPDPAVEI
jgi:ribonuclease D